MNIISHLTESVTPVVTNNKITNAKTVLLEDLYSIIVVRLSDEASYNKLISISNKKKGKKSGKVKYADFAYKLDWVSVANGSKDKKVTIANKLAETHDIGASEVKRMCGEAMPLIVKEIQKLAGDKKVPEFLQEKLNSGNNSQKQDTSVVSEKIPNWALEMFPIALLPSSLKDKVPATGIAVSSDNVKAKAKSIKEPIAVKKHQDKKQSSDEKDGDSQKESTVAEEVDKNTDIEKHKKQKERESTTNKIKPVTKSAAENKKKLPEPVHVSTPDLTEPKVIAESSLLDKGSDKEINKSPAKEGVGGFMKLLPLIGFVILAIIGWSMLKGCQESKLSVSDTATKEVAVTDGLENREPVDVKPENSSTTTDPNTDGAVEVEAINDNIKDPESTTDNTAISSDSSTQKDSSEPVPSDVDTVDKSAETTTVESVEAVILDPATLEINIDKNGQLANSKMISGSQDLDNQVKSSLIDIFGEVSESSEFSIDQGKQSEMPAVKRLNDLLILIKNVPESTLTITGTDIVLTAPDDKAQEKLITSVQALLPSFIVASEIKVKEITTAAQTTEQPQASTTEQNKASEETQGQQQKANTESAIDEIEIKKSEDNAKSEPLTISPGKLDVASEVKKSIAASNKALDELADKSNFTKDELSAALNLQVINFSVNQAKIPEENQKLLVKAAKLMKKLPNARLRIIGHTDSDGSADYNERLSNDRAFAVKKFFISQGIKSVHMKEIGMGEEKPVAKNDTAEGKFRNRRIEFIVKQVKPKADAS